MKIKTVIRRPLQLLTIVTALFSFATAAFAQSGTWTNASSGSWTNAANWSGGTVATNSGNTADFSTLTLGSAPTVTLDGARTIGNLTFGDVGNTYGWALNTGSAGPLTLAVSAGSPVVTVNNQTATIGAVLAGASGLSKAGSGTLVLTAANTYIGTTSITNGTVTYSGSGTYAPATASLLNIGNGANASSKGVLNMNSSGTVNFNSASTPSIGGNGGTADAGAGAINQTSGTLSFLTTSSAVYMTLGNNGTTAGSAPAYGSINLSGGTFIIGSSSGFRLGYGGRGSYVQSGGAFTCNRYFAIGGGSTSGNGVATFSGGSATIASGFRFLIPDTAAVGVLNIGTEAGGTALVTNMNTTGVVLMNNVGGGNGTLNLNSGSLTLGGPINKANTAGTGTVNLNGGSLVAGANNVALINNTPTSVNIYNGGAVMDTLANTATASANMRATVGNGIYPSGGTFAIASGGGSGYIGAPLVTVTNTGSGSGAMAIANVSGGVVTGVTLTCPGQSYSVGDVLGFVFNGGAATSAASTYLYTIVANDLSPNTLGGLTKNGSGTLNLTGTNTYTGNTTVNVGTLNVTADSGLAKGNVVVANSAVLTLGGGVTNGYIATSANLVLGSSALANLNFTGTNSVNGLSLDGGATYVAVGTYGSSSSPAVNQNSLFTGTGVINVTAQPASATVALASSLNPAEITQSITFTATVTGSSGTPTGTVTFKDGAVTLGTVTPNGSGVATFTTTSFAIGSHTILATYNGNPTYAAAASSPLSQVVNPRNDIWSGSVNNVWNINTTSNWLNLATQAVYHDNDQAQFDDTATGSTDVSLGVTVVPYAVVVTNVSKNYSLSGAGAISGAVSLTKLGTGTLTISNANSYTGLTAVQNGTLNFNGSSSSSGNGVLNVGNGSGVAVLNLNSSGTLSFINSFTSVGGVAGNSSDTGSGTINQTAGTLNVGNNYLELGAGGPSAYGCYNLSGGALNIVNASGVRLGASGLGIFNQSGGTFTSTRWLAIGTGTGGGPIGGGSGVATFSGGSASVSSGFRIILGDKPGAIGVFNLGTEAGGTASVSVLYNSGGNGGVQFLGDNAAGSGVLNVNSGTLQLAGAIYRNLLSGGSDALNLNGGTLQASNNVSLIDSSVQAVKVFKGGAVIDSQSYSVTNAANLQPAAGNGIYPAGGTLTVSSGGGSGYIGAPMVAVSGGSGSGAMAIANISGGVVTSVILTCPGENYQAGDAVSFVFTGGGTATPATTFNYTLLAGDVAANNGGLTKVGSGTLVLTGNNAFTGPTLVKAGTLVVNTAYGNSAGACTVTNGSTLNVGIASAGQQLSVGSLSFAGTTGALTLDLTAAGSLTAAPVAVNGALNVSGVATINVAISGITVGTYQLIQYGSLTGTGSFALGSLPVGVQAHLVTNAVASPNSIDLVVTSSGQPRWDGQVVGGKWDINVSTNWVDELTLQASYYQEGKPVLFDDNAAGTTTVNLVANVHPGSVTFNNSSLAYTLMGTNKISGSTGLTVQGGNSVTIQNALNDYTGVTVVGGGTLNVTNLATGGSPSAIGAASASSANLVFTNNGNLNYSGPATAINRGYTVSTGGGTLTVNANVNLSGAVVTANSGSFTKAGSATLTYSGSVINQLGATNNIADGTVVLDGSAGSQSNSVTGLMLVGSAGPTLGALVVTNTSLGAGALTVDYGTASLRSGATVNNNGALNVGQTSGANSVVTVADNAALTSPNNVFIGGVSGNGVLNLQSTGTSTLATGKKFCVGGAEGAGDNGAGAVNQIAGTINISPASSSDQYLELGAGGGGAYGAYTLSGGSLIEPSSYGVRVGASGLGVFTQSGGTLACGRYFAIGTISTALTTGGQGVATFTGGTASIDSGFRFILGDKPSSTAMLNLGTVAGGSATVVALGGNAVQLLADNAATSATLNLNRGTLQLGGPIYKNTGNTGGTDSVNLNGGTLQAGANNVTLANNSLDNVNVYNGGVIVDSQTNTATISANLLATTGNGAYPSTGSFTVTSGGSGYIGAPLVSVTTSGSGVNATAIANITGGVVSSVTITCPGQGYVVDDTLIFDFTGGGATSPAGTFTYTLLAGDLTANATGGLTKIGTGKLTLSGTNNYSGTTVVSNGTLSVTGSLLGNGAVTVNGGATLGGSGLITSAVNVNSNATLAAGTTAIGLLTVSNNLTFAAGATNYARLNKTQSTNDSVAGLAQVSYAGTFVVTNLAGTLAAGDKFTLFSAATRTGSFATLSLPTLAAGLGWSNSLAIDGSIQVVATVNPNPTNITFSVSGNVLTLSWPADHTGWRLMVQTNNLASGISANTNDWMTVPGSTSINQTNITMNPAKLAEFYRLAYP